jgi:hypothetical protein
MRGLLGSVMFVVCVATAACGSSARNTENISCDSFTACGGDLVGTWRVVSSCGSVSSSPCPPSERISFKSSVTATYAFASDGTFTFAASGDLTEALHYPLACLGGITDAGIPQACADIERTFLTTTQTGDAGTQTVVKSASCSTAANNTCACTAVLTSSNAQTTGSYTTSGNQLTLAGSALDGGVRDAGADSVWEYCVSGNTLTLHSFSSSGDGVTTLTR